MATVQINGVVPCRFAFEVDVPDEIAEDPEALLRWVKNNCRAEDGVYDVDPLDGAYIEAEYGVVLQQGDY